MCRRRFLQIAAATGTALALGPQRWGWAGEQSPFGPLQDDDFLRLPEGFSYRIIAETGTPLPDGPVPYVRPQFPDLNAVFPQPDGKLLLSTSHEVPPFADGPVPPMPNDYDPVGGGAITSLLLNPDLSIAEGAYNAGGMSTNCSGSGTPWGTVLTGEEDLTTMGNEHGFVWEVDPHRNTKVRLDTCGKFEHETAVVDPGTGLVYLTEDSGTDSLLYRMRPAVPGDLARGGVLEAYSATGSWVEIPDPTGAAGEEPAQQGVARGALRFKRLEGGLMDGPWFYFTETEDDTACGRIWRIDREGHLEVWAEGSASGVLCMPDNIALDAARNMFVAEDMTDASTDRPNQVIFIDRRTGEMAVFAELAFQFSTPGENLADEPTGTVFSPEGHVMFINFQRQPDFGRTVAITGPFAAAGKKKKKDRGRPAAAPRSGRSKEQHALSSLSGLAMPLGSAAALVALRRRGRIDGELPDELEAVARELGEPPSVETPKRRPAKF